MNIAGFYISCVNLRKITRKKRKVYVVGYKYLDFGSSENPITLDLLVSQAEDAVDGSVEVWLDAPEKAQGGTLLGSVTVSAAAIAGAQETDTATDGTVWSWVSGMLDTPASGVHGVYLVFHGNAEGYICRLDALRFSSAA